jgi:WD40 repeat protein
LSNIRIANLAALLLVALCCTIATAQKPELLVQSGHLDGVRSVGFSPDGRLLASGAFDNTIKLWDVANGRELRTLRGHANGISAVAFSPDGQMLASTSLDNTLKLWETATGKLLFSMRSVCWNNALVFSPDGKLLATLDSNTVMVLDVATQQKRFTLDGHQTGMDTVAFSPDGRVLASGGESSVKLWDVKTGAELRTLSNNAEQDISCSLAFSPDGRTLVSGGRKVVKGGDKTIVSGTIIMWDAATWTPRRVLQAHPAMIGAIAISPDGRFVVSGAADKTVKLWDAATGALLRTYTGHRKDVNAVAFSADGGTIASCSGETNEKAKDHEVKLWSVSTSDPQRTLTGRTHLIRAIALSRDGQLLASGGGNDATIKLWNTSANRMLTLKGHRTYDDAGDKIEGITALDLSPDGKLLASGSFDETVKLWDTATGKELRTLLMHGHDNARAVAFSPDGKILAVGTDKGFGEQSHLILWDVATGRELVGALKSRIAESDGVEALSFSRDGRTLVSNVSDYNKGEGVHLWDVATGKLLNAFYPRVKTNDSAFALSPDDQTIAFSGSDGKVKLWDATTGAERRTLAAGRAVRGLCFSEDGRTLAGVGEGDIILWDVATGQKVRSLGSHAGGLHKVRFVGGDKMLLTVEETTIKLWDAATGKELANLMSVDDDDWLVVLADGSFDGSPAGWNRVLWRFSESLYDVAPVEVFFNEFYNPGLLTDLFVRQQIPSLKSAQDIARKDRRQPVVRLTRTDARASGGAGTPVGVVRSAAVEIAVAAAPADAQHSSDSGVQDLRLFRNGSLVKVWHGDVLRGQAEATLTASVSLVAGKNQLTAYAFNRDNVKSADATVVLNGAEVLRRQGTAYVLAVGVNSYADHDFDLKYAVADAEDFAGEWQRQQAKLGAYANTKIIALTNEQATKSNILAALSDLAAKVQPEDAAVIYFAGHGTAQQNRFYLIPHDLGYEGGRDAIDEAALKTILTHSVSDVELQDALEGVDAGQLLMVIDACNSGQALESEEQRRGPMNSKGLAQLAYEKGMYILTAAQSYQAAQEASKFGHGFLTFALVEEGMKQSRADYEPKDGAVLAREWFDYATERVPQMQLELMREAQAKRGVKVAFVKGEEQIDDPAKRNLQHPRVFYRREGEASPVVVARP